MAKPLKKNRLGEKLRELIDKRTTIAALSRDSGVSRATIYAIINGACDPKIDTLRSLGAELGANLVKVYWV